MEISTHAPLAGRDRPPAPAWHRQSNFNPRAPCGARRLESVFKLSLIIFQPTRPLRGATSYFLAQAGLSKIFQPTRPLRGATRHKPAVHELHPISTHAPLAGRDGRADEGRLVDREISTHAPLAGRDQAEQRPGRAQMISTHAPLAGRDRFQRSPPPPA